MTINQYKQGTIIHQAGQPVQSISIVSQGTVNASSFYNEYQLEKGDAIGIIDVSNQFHSYTYTALTDCVCFTSNYENSDSLFSILQENPDISSLFIASITKQIIELFDTYTLSQFSSDNFYHYLQTSFEEYKNICSLHSLSPKLIPGLESISPMELDEPIGNWMCSYYDSMRRLSTDIQKQFFKGSPALCVGYVIKASEDSQLLLQLCEAYKDYNHELSHLLLNEEGYDFFDLLTELYFKIAKKTSNTMSLEATISKLMIQLEGNPSIDPSLLTRKFALYREQLISQKENGDEVTIPTVTTTNINEFAGSMDIILKYAECSLDFTNLFKSKINAYKKIIDKNSDDKDLRLLRKEITDLFFKLYTSVFKKSIGQKSPPTIVKMFLDFGYVDEELTGIDNTNYLYSISDLFHGDAENRIFTLYEWLLLIYSGKKEPSYNEYGIDYTAYIHEQKVTNKITAETELILLKDNMQKAMYELQNMFPIVNKITFGRITTYCPVLSEHNMLKSLENSLISTDEIVTALNSIKSIDFSAFYQEIIYTNPAFKIGKEMVHIEVLPDVILMPNIGSRGIMWQDIEGKRRATPARMMLPVFYMGDLTNAFIKLVGEYRWEICKRIQGVRWNDISDPSLTSDYCDYIQFYKKNPDLSPTAKEQVKLSLSKSKNSYKEVFISDYVNWILFEGAGAPRLNKISRKILLAYCPFSSNIRKKLSTNPLYKDILDRADIKTAQKVLHIDNIIKKLAAMGVDAPIEILAEKEFFQH